MSIGYRAAALAALSFFTAQSAQATVVWTDANIGCKIEVNYRGQIASTATDAVSAQTIFTFKSISADKKSWTFSYQITNTSSAPSSLRAFGFNDNVGAIGGNVTKVVSTGTFNYYIANGHFPEGQGNVDRCFSGSKNCTGGTPKEGLAKGQIGSGDFTVTFNIKPVSYQLDTFVTRFQAIEGIKLGTSGIGKMMSYKVVNVDGSPGPIPEPSQWALLIAGFGLVGSVLRRHRRTLATA